ncbi:MAG TPA: aminotransferase class IV, partial [Thermoanaerobaculia bacterium]|nr:aminotransferase class IV [Thermoanaerobaculia bacterium]
LVPRAQAKVSVFDSSVQGGDAVWEGLRVYDRKVFRLEQHLDRLEASAKALAFAQIPPRDEIKRALFDTLVANRMKDGAHVRLTLTRGVKVTSGMSPRWNRSGPCLIVLAEWKAPVYGSGGIKLITSSVRRNAPQCIDSKIHHNNLVNNILAKVEADAAGADDAIMLDVEGYVAETNATNLFLVKKGVLRTPTADHCLPGITRAVVLEIARDEKIPHEVRRVSLSEFHSADEVFTTGTMGELAWVREIDGREIDGRKIGGRGIAAGKRGPITQRLCELFADRTRAEGERIPS